MSYTDHFSLVDDVSAHFDATVLIVDPLIRSRYAGFYAVASAAVLELALKDIIISFARNEHPLFGDYLDYRYDQINGRIKLTHIKEDHLKPFGTSYKLKFDNLLKRVERYNLRSRRFSIMSSYSNLLVCRHTFAHEGIVPAATSYEDVKLGFEAGKMVMGCLSKSLK